MDSHDPIAVVAMAGVFPGADNLDLFWQNIINGVDASREVHPERWNVDPDLMISADPRPDKAYSRRCCPITEFEFDATGIELDKNLIAQLDPLYHIVLHVGREALSSLADASINRERTGVILAAIALPTDSTAAVTRDVIGAALEKKLFSGIAPDRINTEPTPLSRSHYLASRVTSLPGAILAKAFGLGGGTYTLDAACASSLYSVKLACDELHSQRADVMLAGGVSRPNSLFTQVGFSQLRALSPSGRCAPFDQSADGLVVGEGAGLVVLKRLADAVRDQDSIHGLIHGVGLANDMRGNLLAPDSEGQLRAMRKVYKSSGWSPQDIDLIECHGAGTPLGDQTELSSLKQLWGDSGWTRAQCAIGSVKSMIGHLLTAAGAAGMIKSLLALSHKTLPPSLNFKSAPQNSPLHDGPFRVQTTSASWPAAKPGRPRRAAVNAFGFGGINAHMLLEEYDESVHGIRYTADGKAVGIDSNATAIYTAAPSIRKSEAVEETNNKFVNSDIPQSAIQNPKSDIAIVGMEASFGSITSLRAFQELIFAGKSNISDRPRQRWKGCDRIAGRQLNSQSLQGGFINDISIAAGEFHIPPNEIPDILPQQLLMLKVAAKAILDAGLPLRRERPEMGAIIGIDFDLEATNFHLRWHLTGIIDHWIEKLGWKADHQEKHNWLMSVMDSCSPPLTASRTLGALGGIVASRVAREFRLGGPSFVVSCEDAGGLKALEIGVRALQQSEAEIFLIGAVDLYGDVRNLILTDCARPFSRRRQVRPFDKAADGTLPGEGAAALIIKRLDRALADGDRIYSVIRGVGGASGGGIDTDSPTRDTYLSSLEKCCREAHLPAAAISFVEAHGSSNPAEDDLESEALNDFFGHRSDPCAVGSTKPSIGHAGAASALASLVKASLCLYQEILPPLTGFTSPKNQRWFEDNFHFPIYPQYWLRDRSDGPRTAIIGSMTPDGNCAHVALEGYDYQRSQGVQAEAVLHKVQRERNRPLGLQNFALFAVDGSNRQALLSGLDSLQRHIDRNMTASGAERDSTPDRNIEEAARTWYLANGTNHQNECAVSIAAAETADLIKWIADAREAILSDTPLRMGSTGGIHYSPHPKGLTGELAFVFPGSGNHYLGMGREIGIQWPRILRDMDARTSQLKTQLVPECYVPWRSSWETGWQTHAYQKIVSAPHHMIFGQVVHGGVMADLAGYFGLHPSAVIGYSLGESAGYFAMGVWPERGEMLKRMQATNLFTTELAGECNAARQVWGIDADEDVNWTVAVVNRSAAEVRRVLNQIPTARLLIVNTPGECVIGGRLPDIKAAIKDLNCEAIFLDGVVTVHCDALKPVADAYRDLHLFPASQPQDVRFYSCALGRAYRITSDKAANSIHNQALHGFDFAATVNQAYQDGVRIFLEMGPYSSCTRMINQILREKSYLALSACVRGEPDYTTIIKVLAALFAERVPIDLDALYGNEAYAPTLVESAEIVDGQQIKIIVGGNAEIGLPVMEIGKQRSEVGSEKSEVGTRNLEVVSGKADEEDGKVRRWEGEIDKAEEPRETPSSLSGLIDAASQAAKSTAEAHQKFLELSSELTQTYAETFNLQTKLLQRAIADSDESILPAGTDAPHPEMPPAESKLPNFDIPTSDFRLPTSNILFDREACLEFAVGSVARVLGPEFAPVDGYDARVRLPDEPLMLVDRILAINGEKGSLGSGSIVTEHDVLPDAWYLDGGHAPVCISVEAGQADLFLCAYLGIDLKVQGRRTYRLLDATVKFHRELPVPGETIRYEIEIEKFLRQGETYLFLFHFNGFIGDTPLITMTNGCAGFFTEEEVKNSGGIILTEEDRQPQAGIRPANWQDLVPLSRGSYDAMSIQALRDGNLSQAFGGAFEGLTLPHNLRLPGGRMKLIDRVANLEPAGGRFGLGLIRAEADIQPDNWFLTCHFVDDMVMPGTLMYECCAHTLRIFLQRIGWATEKPDVFYEPVREIEATLKCRGPVTPATEKVIYEIEIKEIGYRPEPYVIADAYMYADGHRIVYFRNMSMQMSAVSRDEIESLWDRRKKNKFAVAASSRAPAPPLFDRGHMLEFAEGRPSKAFGDRYEAYDRQRFIARLPRPPYLLIDRIVKAEPEPWKLKPDGWIEAECDIDPEAWYFKAEKAPAVPISILLEIALQPCGWLAAYMGSALHSQKDLRFRNLGGSATLSGEVPPDARTLTINARLTSVSEAADMIIEHFDFKVSRKGRRIYAGSTYFGFFTPETLAQQEGIRDAAGSAFAPAPEDMRQSLPEALIDRAPLAPMDQTETAAPALTLPAKAIRMIDRIESYQPTGGPGGLGFIRGIKTVDPREWFFKAHFYQDPVCPGSLGIESFIQLLKFAALKRWPHLANSHRFALVTGLEHSWTYRGQIVPENKIVTVDAVVTDIRDEPEPAIQADGYLMVDGLYIYKMEGFGIQLVPVA